VLNHPTVAKLHTLRLTGMAAALQEQSAQPDIDRLGFDGRLGLLVDREAPSITLVHRSEIARSASSSSRGRGVFQRNRSICVGRHSANCGHGTLRSDLQKAAVRGGWTPFCPTVRTTLLFLGTARGSNRGYKRHDHWKSSTSKHNGNERKLVDVAGLPQAIDGPDVGQASFEINTFYFMSWAGPPEPRMHHRKSV
jgi:hypothetical protein